MPINDAFMLPKRVRTMEQMADLLQTEQTELTQTQRTIAALEQQLNISTSTFLLPRHERLFELPVNTTESLEARRAKVLAKLNTRGTTTVEAIRGCRLLRGARARWWSISASMPLPSSFICCLKAFFQICLS